MLHFYYSLIVALDVLVSLFQQVKYFHLFLLIIKVGNMVQKGEKKKTKQKPKIKSPRDPKAKSKIPCESRFTLEIEQKL